MYVCGIGYILTENVELLLSAPVTGGPRDLMFDTVEAGFDYIPYGGDGVCPPTHGASFFLSTRSD